MNCPEICPSMVKPKKKVSATIMKGSASLLAAAPYRPGMIQPRTPKLYPPPGPPGYLPQSVDVSGDILTMGPIDPWAAGHMDWSPEAGITGVRPVVDKYSITRYNTGEWRKHNAFVLQGHITEKGRQLIEKDHREIDQANKDIDNKGNITNQQLAERIKELCYWKKQAENAQKRISDEVEALEVDRVRLKGASRILMLPEAIGKECIELRTHRLEPDLVRDDAEQELIREVAIVGEIRRSFNELLVKVETQLAEDRAAKAAIELDWGDKMAALREDKYNLSLTPDSAQLEWHAGVARWPENTTSLEYWKHFCQEIIKNTDEVRQRSNDLRQNLSMTLTMGARDMQIQGERTNMALGETISATEQLCEKLEESLKDNLERIADIEKLLDYLNKSLRELDDRKKLSMSRLHSRNFKRPNVENCKDQAQYALMDEIKLVNETVESFTDKKREADMVRAELMKARGDLEKEIACKRKSLNIDRDRLSRVRAHMPKPEEFSNG